MTPTPVGERGVRGRGRAVVPATPVALVALVVRRLRRRTGIRRVPQQLRVRVGPVRRGRPLRRRTGIPRGPVVLVVRVVLVRRLPVVRRVDPGWVRRPTGIRRGRTVPATCRTLLGLPVRRDGRSRPTPGTSPTRPPARRRLRRAGRGAVGRTRRLRRVPRERRARDRAARLPGRLLRRRRAGMCRRRWFRGSVRKGSPVRVVPVGRTLLGVRLRVGFTMPRRCLPTPVRVGLRGRVASSRPVPKAFPVLRARPSRPVLLVCPAPRSSRTPPAWPVPPARLRRRTTRVPLVPPAPPPRRVVVPVPCIVRRPCWPGRRRVDPVLLRHLNSRARPVRRVLRGCLRGLRRSRCLRVRCHLRGSRHPATVTPRRPGPVSRSPVSSSLPTAIRSRGSRPWDRVIRPCCGTARRTGPSSS